ncbi:MAG: tetratricopeptide (TPR) repeat protein [Planctomycetota bacterium]|jgi:tetratricopeptide (TPR) repeat protein
MRKVHALLLFGALLLGGLLVVMTRKWDEAPDPVPQALELVAPDADEQAAGEDSHEAPAAIATAFLQDHPTNASMASAGVGRQWLDRNDAGIAALKDGKPALAVGLFESCVQAHPDQPIFARNLAIALEALARLRQESDDEAQRAESLELLARAIELYPGEDQEAVQLRARLAQRLKRWRSAGSAEEDFLDDGHIHFQLSYDGDRGSLRSAAPWILEQLENAYLDFAEVFGHFPVESGRGRIRVVLMARTEFDAATGLGDWAGGAFDGTVRIPVEVPLIPRAHERLVHVLRHELVHAFVRAVGGVGVPGWLNEGLAQRLERSSRGGQAMALQVARVQLKGQKPLPLKDLRGGLGAWDDPQDIVRAYAQSHAFVAFIEQQYGLPEVLAMVEACASKGSPQAAFQRRVGVELELALGDLFEGLGPR